jgi:hypothetical protein
MPRSGCAGRVRIVAKGAEARRMKTMIVNILLAAVCVITCADVIRRYSDPVDPIRATQASLGPAHGSIMRLGGERWDDRRTFVIAVSPGCHSCTASAPFYRKLLDAARMHRVPVIVLGQDPESVTRVYLRGLGLDASNVRHASFSTIGIRLTPTILLAGHGDGLKIPGRVCCQGPAKPRCFRLSTLQSLQSRGGGNGDGLRWTT